MGIEDAATISSTAAAQAARAVRDLTASQSPLRSRPAGPSGRTRAVVSSPPTHLGIVDHMLASRDEIAEHARAAVPADAVQRPLPREAADIYAWIDQHTPYIDPETRRAGEALMYRQRLQHRLMEGDVDVVRKERCPSCRCLSLSWKSPLDAAVCANMRCVDSQGLRSRFTLAELAEKAVRILTIRAAT